MAFNDLFAQIAERFRQGPFAGGDEEGQPNLPSGGTTGYHPVTERKRHSLFGRRAQQAGAAEPAGIPGQPMSYPGAQPQMGYPQPTGYPGAQPQMGYTGMNPQPMGYPGAQQTGYTGMNPQPMGYPAPQQTGFQPAQTARPGQMGSGYQGAFQPAQEEQYQQSFVHQEEAPYQSKWQRQEPAEDRNRRFGREEAPAPQPFVPNNVSYMPNMFVGDNGMGYRHVERLTQPMSASTCYRLIEFMRNGESVIVNTELIRDDRENQRCLDLLYGAAYTMKCTFTRISSKSIYLIAPATVSVIPYESIRQMNDQDAALRWPGAEEGGNSARRGGIFGSYRAAE